MILLNRKSTLAINTFALFPENIAKSILFRLKPNQTLVARAFWKSQNIANTKTPAKLAFSRASLSAIQRIGGLLKSANESRNGPKTNLRKRKIESICFITISVFAYLCIKGAKGTEEPGTVSVLCISTKVLWPVLSG